MSARLLNWLPSTPVPRPFGLTFWIAIDAVYTGSRARYVDSPDGVYGAGAGENAGELGVSAVQGRWEASARLRYLGPYALVPSNTHRANAETMLNFRLAYRLGAATLYGAAHAHLDAGRLVAEQGTLGLAALHAVALRDRGRPLRRVQAAQAPGGGALVPRGPPG